MKPDHLKKPEGGERTPQKALAGYAEIQAKRPKFSSLAPTALGWKYEGGGGCDWEFANELKHFRIFEKLMNSEILEKIEINEFIFGGQFSEFNEFI